MTFIILFDDRGLCFGFNLSCRDQSIDLKCGLFVWYADHLVHGIEINLRTTCGLFIVVLTGLLCPYLIGYFSLVFFLYLTCYFITDQWCAK